MSFFTNKLLHRKTSRRKITKSLTNINENPYGDNRITLELGNLKTTFDNGQWIHQFGECNEMTTENTELKEKLNKLQEENNLLKLKNEILLDLLAQNLILQP